MENKDLAKLFTQINKQFGAQTIQMLTEEFVPQIKTYSTSSKILDLAIGRGGIPSGRIVEVFGPEASGKTTLSFLHAAEVQKAGEGLVAFIDAEHAFDPLLAASYGVNLDQLTYINPQTAENAIDIAEALIRSGLYRLVIIDSVSALTPTKIVESSIEQQTMGLLARFMSTTCQKLNGIAYQNDCTILFINQIREKIGGWAPAGQVATTTSGGRALPFYASLRLNVRRAENIKEKGSDDTIGHWMKVKVVKNKIGAPFKEAHFPLYYTVGVDNVYELVELACLANIIVQRGAWFSYRDENDEIIKRGDLEYKWQGKANLTDFVRENDDFFEELHQQVVNAAIEAPQGAPVSQDGYEFPDEVQEALDAAAPQGEE
jgi:recombination protein RecA